MSNYKKTKLKNTTKANHFTHLSQVKLPSLQSRQHQQDNKQVRKVLSNKLPLFQGRQNLRYNSPLKNSHSVLSQINRFDSPDIQMSNGFPEKIEEKINKIFKQNEFLQNEYYNSENQNFETHILKNKEFLKMQREKRGSNLSKRQELDNSSKQKSQKIKDGKYRKKGINSSKRMFSRNRLGVQSPSPLQKIVESNFSTNSLVKAENINSKTKQQRASYNQNNKLEQRVSELKQKLSKRKLNKRNKLLTQAQKNETQSQNLFDTIHNYLANPQRCFSNYKNTNFKISFQQRRNRLLKELNNLEKRQNTHGQQKALNLVHHTSKRYTEDELHWRRVELIRQKDKSNPILTIDQSNFQKEINHLGLLQQRNEYSLQKYIQNQRMLFDLKLIKSKSSKNYLRREFLSK